MDYRVPVAEIATTESSVYMQLFGHGLAVLTVGKQMDDARRNSGDSLLTLDK